MPRPVVVIGMLESPNGSPEGVCYWTKGSDVVKEATNRRGHRVRRVYKPRLKVVETLDVEVWRMNRGKEIELPEE